MRSGLDVVEVQVLIGEFGVFAYFLEVGIVNAYRPELVAGDTCHNAGGTWQAETFVESGDDVVDGEVDCAAFGD